MSAQTPYIAAGPYQEIVSGIELIFSFSDGVVKLIGPPGWGKTRLLQQLQRALAEERQESVLFSPPPSSVQQLHNILTRKFSLGADLAFRQALARYIGNKPRDQQALILLFDDAEEIDDEVLLDLAKFRELKNNDQGLVSIVLCGRPELEQRLAQDRFEALRKDVILDYNRAPMTLEELSAFCREAIITLSLGVPFPSPPALQRLLAETGALPGAVLEKLPAMEHAGPAMQTVRRAEAPPPEAAVDPDPAPAQTVRLRRTPVLDLEDDDDEGLLPGLAGKLRGIVVGAAAVALTAAAVWFLYPTVGPMIMERLPGASGPTVTTVTTPEPAIARSEEPAPATATEVAPVEEPVEPEQEVQIEVAAEPGPVEPAAETQQPTVATTTPGPEPEPAPEPAPPAPPAPAPRTQTTPVSLLPDFTMPELADASPEALEEVVQQWLNAWQNQDMDGYFGAYHTDFAPLYQGTRAAWRDNRVRALNRPAAISIAIEDFTVLDTSPIGTHVGFTMEYHTPTYADRTRKELVIGHDVDGSLRILQEINRQVTRLMPSQVPGSDQAVAVRGEQPAAPAASGVTIRTRIGEPVQVSAIDIQAAQPSAGNAGISAAALADVSAFLAGWLQAWQRQDVDGYFAHYLPGFRTSAFASHEAWRRDRSTKILRPLAIQIDLQELQVVAYGNTRSSVELRMEYHSSYYADRTVKQMTLQRAGNGSWRISSETNRRVDPLPISRLVPARRLTFNGGHNTIFEHAL